MADGAVENVFSEYSYPYSELTNEIKITDCLDKQFHLFNITYLPYVYRQVFERLPHDTFHYLLSPCLHFWEDVCSERDKTKILKTARKNKQHADEVNMLDSYLSDTNFLLANLGKIKREYLKVLDTQKMEAFERYVGVEDSWIEKDSWIEYSLLDAVKQDLLHMRNIEETETYSIKKERESIEIHEAPSKYREIEILYDYILKVLSNRKNEIKAADIKIYAPEIKHYLPYIHLVFGGEDTPFNYMISDLDNVQSSFFAQALLHFFSLVNNRWDMKNGVFSF